MISPMCIQDNITGWGCSKFSDRVNLLTNKLARWEATSAKIHLCVFFDLDEKGTAFHRTLQNDSKQNNLAKKINAELHKIINQFASIESENHITFDLNLFVKIESGQIKKILSLGTQTDQFIWFNQCVSVGDVYFDEEPTQMGPFKKKTFLKNYATIQKISRQPELTIFDRKGNFSIL